MSTTEQNPEQKPYEPQFQVMQMNHSVLGSETALLISEQLTHTFSVAPAAPEDEEVAILLKGSHPVRSGLIALPLGNRVMILRLTANSLAATGMYLAVAREHIEDVERAVFGLAKDFKVLNIQTQIEYLNEENVVCTAWSSTLQVPSERLQAVWFDFEPYMDELSAKTNVTVEEVKG